MFRILLLVLATMAASVHARELTKEQKLEDFHTLVSVINAGYGPLEYKAANKIVDISLLNKNVEQEIANTTSNRDFYYTMVKYVASYRDGHFGIYVPSTEVAVVPIVTDLVDGKILITKIDRSKLPQDKFKFEVGDEIVSIDGLSAGQFLDQVVPYIGSGNPASQRRFAAWTTFFRRAQRMPIPADNVKIVKVEIRRGTSAIIEPAELEWTKIGDGLDEKAAPSSEFTLLGLGNLFTKGAANFDRLNNDSYQAYVHPLADRDYSCSGATRITIPADATVIMKDPFVAYYHPTSKGNIGYLRIPHYYPQPKVGENETDVTLKWVNQYEFAIGELEKNTVGLIIDQDHNCGGSVWVVNKMVSMFMDKPFEVSKFEVLATKESYLQFKEWVVGTAPFTYDFANVTKVLNLIKSTWETGTSRLTTKTALDGQDIFPPNLVHYTKPVVMLIDEIAGSGGDMFPATMKGIGRAKLFGQTTSGLGGHVTEYPAPLPNSQMRFRMTKSLFYRPDGVAIENNGAVPDKEYVITRDDVLYGFKDYQKAYLAYLFQFLP